MNNNQTREIRDALIAAYLDTRGFKVETKLLKSGKVAFEVSGKDVSGKDVSSAVDAYYRNDTIPVLSFTNAYRKMKVMIFDKKGM